MATPSDLLADAFERIRECVHDVLDDVPEESLAARPAPEANTIAWLLWHLTRIMDDHVAGAQGDEQLWTRDGWAERFGLPFDVAEHGYGHTAEEVGRVRPSADLLRGYHDAVQEYVQTVVAALEPADLERVVDERWDPPVTYAVRLVSVVNDAMQHVGQAAYVAGLLGRAGS